MKSRFLIVLIFLFLMMNSAHVFAVRFLPSTGKRVVMSVMMAATVGFIVEELLKSNSKARLLHFESEACQLEEETQKSSVAWLIEWMQETGKV